MRRSLCIVAAVAALVLAAAAVASALVLLGGGISAREEPSRLETSLARTLRSSLVPASAREAANPIPPGPEVLAEGRAHFADHCALCHANDGSGDTRIGRGLYPRPPDMRTATTQELTDGELFYIIENGVKLTGMPAWGRPGSEEGSWMLVHFIRHLPRLTEEEKAEMEAMNPRSPAERRVLEEEEEFLRSGRLPPPGGEHRH